MGKTISIKVLFGIYLLLMAGKVFAFSCNVDGGSSIGAGTTSVYVNLDPVIQPGQNLVVDLSQHISCWNEAQKYPLAYIAQANKSSHFIFRVPPLTVADKCLLTQHLMQQKHREWVSL